VPVGKAALPPAAAGQGSGSPGGASSPDGGQSADLSVTKEGATTAFRDSDVSYTLTIANNGPGSAASVTMSDTLPGNMTFVLLKQDTGPTFNCSTPTAGGGGTITCTNATFAAGASATFTLVAHVPGGVAAGTVYTNIATASSATPDPNSENNSSRVDTEVSAVADLSALKVGPSEAEPGANVTYTVTIANGGPDAASSVTWVDNVPAGMTFVSLTQDSGPTFSCTTPEAGDDGTVSCSIESLSAGASAEFTLVLQIPDDAEQGTTYTNIATVSSSTQDSNDENNSGAAVTTIPSPYADLLVVKNGPFSAAPGTNVTYTITIANGGPDAAADAAWNDMLPGTMTFVSLDQEGEPVFSCTTPAVGAGGMVTCSISSLPVGASVDFTLVGQIPENTEYGAEFSNTATVSSSTPDPNEENDSSTVTTVAGSADMSVVKSGPVTATAGENITYTLTLANSGPDPATEVTLSDTIPSGLTFVSLTQNNGPAFNCTLPPAGGNGVVICSTEAMLATQSAQFTLVVHAGSSLTTATNTAAVSSSTADTDPSDNSSSATTTFTAIANLAVRKTAPVTVTAGSNISYGIVLSNTGPSDAQSVTLTDALPASTTFVSLVQTSGPTLTCDPPSAGSVTCNRTSLPAGSSASLALTVRPDAALRNGDVITNTASIDSSTVDPTSSDHTSVVTSTVASVADLGITKTHTGTVGLGLTVTYVITVTNSGPSVAYGAIVTDTFQSGLTNITYSCAVQSGEHSRCYTANGSGDINAVVDVDVQGSVVFTATALVTDPTAANLSNTAYVTLPAENGSDPNPSNNSSTDVVGIPPTATQTSTSTTTPTSTSTSIATSTSTVTATATGTSTSTSTAVACGAFTDEPPSATFYPYVQCLSCRGIVSGYPDGTFRESAPITRGQIAKVVSNAAGFTENPGEQLYADVPPTHTFYAFINRLTNRGIVAGYPCPQRPGGGEECGPENPNLFKPEQNATRGQLAKIVSNAAGITDEVAGQYYQDVPPTGEGSQFYIWIMRLTDRGVMSGYACGTTDPRSGPCDAQDRSYFRPGNTVSRGQAAKMVANTFFPNCQTPARQ
jgi:uncharacterized repeat protein (TIGR01451 family)